MQQTQVPSLGQEDSLEDKMTPVFLPGKSQGQKSLAGYSPWGGKESDTTERLNNKQSLSKDSGYKLGDGSEAAYSGEVGWEAGGPKVTPV